MSPRKKRSAAKGARARSARRFIRLPRGWRGWLVLLFGGGFLLFMLSFAALYAFAKIPDPNDISRAQSVLVVDVEGRAVGRVASEADRVSIPLAQMPKHLRQAVIATEDRRFYKHTGVSLPSIARAAIANITGRGYRQGGSTITQQYVKNAFVGNERTMARKVKEAVIAMKLERQRSKDEILELYLNTIYFGRGAYGVQAAAATYFGKHARDLNLAESALLAGIIQSPEDYDPTRDEDAARGRRAAVLRFMVRDRFITEAEAEEAKREPIRARKRRAGGIAPHFLEDVRRFLEDRIGERRLYDGGITVVSTLDLDMQVAADKAIAAVYDRASDPEAALVAIDPHTGAVRAMVGSRDFGRRQLNIASQSRRQPGSTFKPAVLAAAVAEEISIKQKFKAPAEITLQTDSGPWEVSNYDERDYGTLPLTRATHFSVNTVYAQLILKVGPDKAMQMAKDLGIRSKLSAFPSLTLGSFEVTPLELTSMFATLAERGRYHEPYLVQKVIGRGRRVLYEAPPPQGEQRVERNVADNVNLVLEGVIESGTGAAADIGRPAAGKTGTTEEFRDAWFAGYTPELAAVVWNGYPGKDKTLRGVRGREGVTGGSFPAEMWRRFMETAVESLPKTAFAKPEVTEPSPTATASASPTVTLTPSLPPPPKKPLPPPEESPTPKKKKPQPSPSPSPSPSPTDTTATTDTGG